MSQNTIVLPIVGTFSGLTEQGYINNALDTLNTKFSGSSAPSSPEIGQYWLNNNTATSEILNLYDGVNWLPTGVIDTTNSIWTPPIGGGKIPTISSASTTDLGSVSQARKYVSGTTTITNFGTSAVVGTLHAVKFTGALSITASAAIVTLSGSSMSISAGDETIWAYESANVWKLLYWSASSALPSIASHRILANTTGSTAQPAANTLSQVLDLGGATNGTVSYRSGGAWASTGISAILDAILGSTVGGLAVRGSTVWGQTAVGTSGQVLTSNGSAAVPTMQTAPAAGIFTQSFTSTAQTISGGTVLTLAHSLSSAPKMMQCYLQCTTNDIGYVVGNKVIVSSNTMDGSTSRGFASSFDATNVYIVFGSANQFFNLNGASGAAQQITNASWDFYVQAYA